MVTNSEHQNPVPTWLCRYVSSSDLTRISEAVRRAEKTTSGEIVPMIVRRSTFPIPIFLPILLFLMLVSSLCSAWHWQVLHFGSSWLPFAAAADALLLIGISFLISRIPFLQYLFTPREYMTRCCEMRALNEFYTAGLNKTKHGTGILIFISIFEHQAIVLADQTISARLPPETWNNVVAELIAKIKSKRFAEGFMDAVHQCARIAAKEFPAAENDIDELTNHLIIKD